MLKRLISGALTLGILGASAVMPVSAEDAAQSIIAEIFPDNYIIRYGSQYSHTARETVAVNTMPASIRTDQDDMYSRYVIPAPDAVTKVCVNIPKLGLMMKDENTEAIMGMSLRYSFDETELPKGGVYYKTGKYNGTLEKYVPETELPDGATAEECEGVLNSWRDKLFYNRAEAQILINQIKPSTFGITDATTSMKMYDVSKDVTDTVLSGLKNGKDKASLEIMYGPSATYGIWGKNKDYYMNGGINWGAKTSISVTYDASVILEDVNSTKNETELYEKIKFYAPIMGYSMKDYVDEVVSEKIGAYVGKKLTLDGFKEMMEDLKMKNPNEFYAETDSVLNCDSFAKIGDKVYEDSWHTSFYTVDWTSQPAYSKGFFEGEERAYESTDDGYSFNTTGKTVKFKVDENKLSGGVLDSAAVWGGDTVTVAATGEHSAKAYFLMASDGATAEAIVTVNYTDGTKVTKNIAISGYFWAQQASNHAMKRYPDLAGYIFGGWSQLDAARVNDSDEYLTVKDKDGNQTCGVNFYVVDLDPAKRVKSYKFENANAEKMYRYNLFAVTEKALSNNELKEKIAAADLNDEKDMVDAVIFADELRARNAVSSGEYTTLYAAYDKFLQKNGVDKKVGKSFYVRNVKNLDEDGYEVGELKSVKTQGNTLSNLAYKLNNKEAVKIAYVGGSLTYGSGDEANCWRKQNMAWFEENYPESTFTFKNCSIGGVGSEQHLYRTQKMVMNDKPDLVFIDTAVNDHGQNLQTHIKNMEGIIRQIYLANPYAEIIMVDMTTKPIQDSDDKENTYYTSDIVLTHQKLEDYYGLVRINAGKYLFEKIYSGELIEVGDKDKISHNTEEAKKYAYLSNDTVHPTTGGYSAYAECVNSAIGELLKNNAPSGLTQYVMPEKYEIDAYSTYTMLLPDEDCVNTGTFNLGNGRYVGGWTDVPMITYDSADAEMTLSFTGTRFGLTWLDTDISNNAVLDVEIDGKVYTVTLSSPYSSWQSQFTTVATGLSNGTHTAKITVNEKNASYTAKIYGFSVSEDNDRVAKMGKICASSAIASAEIANIGDTDQSFDAYFAIYEKGALKSVRKIVGKAPAREVSYNFISEKITAQEEGDLKILFWEKDGLKPLEDAQLQ